MFLSFWVFDDLFRFSKKLGSGVFFVQENMVETRLPDGWESSGQRAYRKFWHISRPFWVFAFWVIFSVFQKNRVLGYSWSTLLWHRCYYPHRSRDALSPVCGNFFCKSSFYMIFHDSAWKCILFWQCWECFLACWQRTDQPEWPISQKTK